jgi:DNA-binding winged helix-turn-helix (wHTH) protein/predicted ATPase
MDRLRPLHSEARGFPYSEDISSRFDVIYTFEEFELDTAAYELRREGGAVDLEPQVFDVLTYLLQHRDRVVSKQELLENVWKTRFVTESALTSRIKAARKVIGDDGRTQRIIKTQHGRGYRFVASVREQDRPAYGNGPFMEPPGGAPLKGTPHSPLVGRDGEFAALQRLLGDALDGTRRTALVSGEAGLGKTALVEAFVQRAKRTRVATAIGRCLEQRGAAEPYMPLFEVMARLCRGDRGTDVREILTTHAPTWMAEMPWLLGSTQLEELRRRSLGSTRLRMLREIAEALDAISERWPLVLVLEDVQWSDPSTRDAVNALSRRREPARLLLICTCRATDVSDPSRDIGALLQDLVVTEAGEEVALTSLDEAAVGQYLDQRLPQASLPEEIVHLLTRRTGGNALYISTLVDDWLQRAERVGTDPDAGFPDFLGVMPDSLRRMIDQRVSRLRLREQEVLEAASVVGFGATAALIATALGADDEEVEACCSELSRTHRLLRERGVVEWPDGTVSARFEFAHSLYQERLYERVPVSRRARLHRALGERLHVAYGEQASEHAVELAFHFTRAGDAPRGVAYSVLAAEQALRRFAHTEAIKHVEAGLLLVGRLSKDEGSSPELELQVSLGLALIAAHGWAHPGVEDSYNRALELGRALDDPERLSSVLYGLATVLELRGEYERSQDLMEERLVLEARMSDSRPLVESHELLACSTFHQGAFEDSLGHADEGWSLYDSERHVALIAVLGENPGVSCNNWAALDLWFLGYPDKAVDRIARAVKLAEDPAHFFSLAHAHEQAATVYQLRREPQLVLEHATATIDLGNRQGFSYRVATGTMLQGWARATMGEVAQGIEDLRAGLDGYVATGARMDLPYYMALLADAYLLADLPRESLKTAEEALLAAGTRGYCYEAELHRLKGLARLRQAQGQGSRSLRRALDVARGQNARILELRAAASLGAHARDAADEKEAVAALTRVRSSLTEGFGTTDVIEADRVLSPM